MRPLASTVALVAALLLGAGCDALRASPGDDFAVTLLDTSPIQAIGRITVPLHFRVTGCDVIEASVSGAAGRHAVELQRLGDEAFTAQVPVEWLRGTDGSCLYDDSSPQESAAQLLVTCLDAGRSVAADLAVRYGTAARAGRMDAWNDRPVVEQIFAHVDPLQPLALAPWTFSDMVGIYPWTSSAVGSYEARPVSSNPLAEPRIAASPTLFFVSMGCAGRDPCPEVPVSVDLKLPGVRLMSRGRGEDGYSAGPPGGFAWVPAQVVDMAFAPDGALVVLSQAGGFTTGGAVVTRVEREPDPVSYRHWVRVIGYFPGERVLTRFSRDLEGALSFLGVHDVGTLSTRTVLRTTDGLTVSSLLDPTGPFLGFNYDPSHSLSPDASLIVVRGEAVGPPGGPFVPLPPTPAGSLWGPSGGTTWPSDAIARWRGESLRSGASPASDVGGVETFDRVPPHARRYGYEIHPLAGVSAPVALYGATAVGDKLVLTTSTGIRVLERSGRVIGGSDPLPCRLAPTAVAAQTGPHHVAVGAGPYVYVFDLSGLDDTLPATPAPAAAAGPGTAAP